VSAVLTVYVENKRTAPAVWTKVILLLGRLCTDLYSFSAFPARAIAWLHPCCSYWSGKHSPLASPSPWSLTLIEGSFARQLCAKTCRRDAVSPQKAHTDEGENMKKGFKEITVLDINIRVGRWGSGEDDIFLNKYSHIILYHN